MSLWNELDLNRHTATWISHGMIGLVAFAVGLVVGEYLPGGPLLWGAITATVQAIYFGLMREPSDIEKHDLAGDSKIPGAQNVTPRVDMYGDQITNWAIAGAATIVFLHSLWWGVTLILALAITALLLVMKIRLIFFPGVKNARRKR
jgi:hypothetical protein